MKRGFTLAELLIALALTALAIAIMSEGVRRTIGFQERLETVRQERETFAATAAAIAGRLDTLIPATRPAADDRTAAQTLFAGSNTRLAFIAADPGYPSRAGLYEYRLDIVAAEAEQPSVLRVSRRAIADLAEFDQPAGDAFISWDLPLPGAADFRYGTTSRNLSRQWPPAAGFPAFVALFDTESDIPLLLVRLPQAPPEANPTPEPAP